MWRNHLPHYSWWRWHSKISSHGWNEMKIGQTPIFIKTSQPRRLFAYAVIDRCCGRFLASAEDHCQQTIAPTDILLLLRNRRCDTPKRIWANFRTCGPDLASAHSQVRCSTSLLQPHAQAAQATSTDLTSLLWPNFRRSGYTSCCPASVSPKSKINPLSIRNPPEALGTLTKYTNTS